MTAAVTGTELARLDALTPYPGNARRGNLDAIRDSLRANGQYRPLVVQRSTGHVLVGNNARAAMLAEGWEEAEVKWLDVDDATARRIVLADNRTSDLATNDDAALLALLSELGEDFAGTGYTPDDFGGLLAALEAADAPLPEPAPRPPATPRAAPTSTEWEESYASRDSRFVTLIYPEPVHAWVTATLDRLAADRGDADQAAAVLRLLEDATGETAPTEAP